MVLGERGVWNRYFIVSVALILMFIFMAILSIKMEKELVRAEKAQFDLRVSELKAAVLLMEASLVAKNRMQGAINYIGSNPLAILDTEEMNYAGEKRIASLSDEELKSLVGMWVFDRKQKTVVYFPRSESFLSEGLAINKPELMEDGLKFKVVGLWSDVGQQKKIKGLRLEALY